QNIEAMAGRTVLEEVMSAAERVSEVGRRLPELEAKLCEPLDEDEMTKILEEYGRLQGEFEQLGGYDLESRASEITSGLGFRPDQFNEPTQSFSGGWKMRIALAKILLIQP